MGYLSALTTFLYYLLYPIAVLLGWIFALLAIVAAPFLYLGHCIIIYTCWYPFHILAKFETLYIYLGVATLVGVLTGTSLHYTSGFIRTLLDLDGREEKPRGMTAVTYRVERQAKQKQKENLAFVPTPRFTPQASVDVSPKEEHMDWLRQDRGRRKGSLIDTTILEEDDSSEEGF